MRGKRLLRAVQSKEQILRVTARFAAKTLARDTDLQWRILEAEANSPELRELLKVVNAHPKDHSSHQAVQAWLDRRKSNRHELKEPRACWINDAIGTQVARTPIANPDHRGESFHYRDYFHGKGTDLPEDIPQEITPTTQFHRSVVFFSKSSGAPMVAFSAPIWSDDFGHKGRHVIGVISTIFHLHEFGALEIDRHGNMVAVLIELNSYQTLDGAKQSGLILHHPYLKSDSNEADADSQFSGRHQIPIDLVQQMNQRRSKRLEDRDYYGDENLLVKYRDPVTDGLWLAAYEPVIVESRLGGDENTHVADVGWAVIVQQPMEVDY